LGSVSRTPNHPVPPIEKAQDSCVSRGRPRLRIATSTFCKEWRTVSGLTLSSLPIETQGSLEAYRIDSFDVVGQDTPSSRYPVALEKSQAVVRRIACLPASKTAVAPAKQPATSRFDPSGGIRRWTCLEPRPTRRCDMVRGHSSCPVAQVGSFPYSTLRHLSRSGVKQANLPGSSRNNCREYRAVPVARASFRPLRASYTCGRV